MYWYYIYLVPLQDEGLHFHLMYKANFRTCSHSADLGSLARRRNLAGRGSGAIRASRSAAGGPAARSVLPFLVYAHLA